MLALAVGSAGASAAAPTRAQVELMPLPRAGCGSLPSSLGLDSSSGWTSNKESAENDLDPKLTGAKLAAMGRITGFDVEFDDLASASKPGLLVDADSEVDLFDSSAGAAPYLAFEAAEFDRFEGKRLQYGIVIDELSFFTVPGLSGARGVHGRIRAGGLTLWETSVQFQVGVLAANVGLGRTDSRNVNADVRRLARILDRRIRGVLAGRVHDKAISTAGPRLGGLGRPSSGPDLATMAIQPADLATRAKPKHEGYERNSDDVAEYTRDFAGVTFASTPLSLLDADVELRPSTVSATGFVALLRSVMHGPSGGDFMREAIVSGLPAEARKRIKLGAITTTPISAGDESFAFATRVSTLGIDFRMVICVVRRGAVVETLTLLSMPNQTIPQAAATSLARTAAARIDQALHR